MNSQMNRKEITALLLKSLEYHLNPKNDTRIYTAKEVTFDYGTKNQVRVDYMQFCPMNNTVSGIEKGDFKCFEIKSCVEDFRSKNGHNFIGDYNYYVMDQDTYEKVSNKIPFNVGVYVLSKWNQYNSIVHLKNVKKAIRTDRSKSMIEMLLMMFRSANRELIKGET